MNNQRINNFRRRAGPPPRIAFLKERKAWYDRRRDRQGFKLPETIPKVVPTFTDNSAAEELLQLVAKGKPENIENIEQVIEQTNTLLDILWRKIMSGKEESGDRAAVDAGQKFLREIGQK